MLKINHLRTYTWATLFCLSGLASQTAEAQVVDDVYGPYSIWILQTLAGQALIALLGISGALLLRWGRKSKGVARQRGWVYGGLLSCLAVGVAAVEVQVHQTPKESWREVRVHLGPKAVRVW